MCVTALVAATALSAGASLYSGYQQYEQGKFANEQAKADAMAREGAAQVEAERIRGLTKQQQAKARAAYAGSGVNVDEGSALNINEDIAQRGEQDALTAIMQGRYDSNTIQQQGAIAAYQGRQGAIAGAINAGSTVASGAFNYGKWKAGKP